MKSQSELDAVLSTNRCVVSPTKEESCMLGGEV